MKKTTKLFLVLVTFFSTLFPREKNKLDPLRIVRVNSSMQRIINENEVILTGEVEVIVDTTVHIWADKVFLNKNEKTIKASSYPGTPVLVENKDTVILADEMFFDLKSKTGTGHNLKVHTKDGYLRARTAEKVDDDKWVFKNVFYTACDSPNPHWKIGANKVEMKKGMVHILDMPLFKAPALVGSAPSQSNSGFLLPRLSYSKRLGWGLIQEYYWAIDKNMDTTLGVNWKEEKGFVLYDEFRHISGEHEHTYFLSQYARDRWATINKDRFWITGKHFHELNAFDTKLHNLLRLDFGTDKRIGYDFFYSTDAIEDKFYNSFVSRKNAEEDLISVSLEQDKIFRNRFFFENNVNEREEDSFKVTRFPHIEWNSANKNLLKGIYYKNNIFVDQVFSRKRSFNTQTLSSFDDIALEKADTVRLYYQGSLSKAFNTKGTVFSFNLDPNVQVRSRLKNTNEPLAKKNVFEGRFASEGAYRMFLKSGIEVALPERVFASEDYSYAYYFQPVLKWNYVPKFKQSHWYNSDIWDREYAQNEVSFALRNNWYLDNANLEFNLKVANEFYDQDDIFPLRRGVLGDTNILPIKLDGRIDTKYFRLSAEQEYDLQDFTLLDSALDVGLHFKESSFYASFLYQNPRVQKTRELLSDTPSFANLGFRVPLYTNAHVNYDAHFYSPSNSFFGIFRNSDALLHRIRLSYRGHCWAVGLGFEEKRYRRSGNVKSEQSYFLSFKLDSLGAFAHHFRKEPEMLAAPADY